VSAGQKQQTHLVQISLVIKLVARRKSQSNFMGQQLAVTQQMLQLKFLGFNAGLAATSAHSQISLNQVLVMEQLMLNSNFFGMLVMEHKC
jgi:hypothetical protein